jgi:hypothetical protein
MCLGCGEQHGILYVCPDASPDVQARKTAEGEKFAEAVQDGSAFPEGTPAIAKAIMAAFAGARMDSQ